MTPQEIEATAQRIIAAAALADGEIAGEPEVCSTALDAALTVEAAVRELSEGTAYMRGFHDAATPDDDSDEAWFAAHPDRTARLRPHRCDERRPWWAADGQSLMAVVRCMSRWSTPSVEAIAADALGSEPIADTDEAVLRAMRRAQGLHY